MINKEELESEHYRGYSDFRKYKKDSVYRTILEESIMVGLYHPGGGTTGEFEFIFEVGENALKSCVTLKSYDDSWHVLSCFGDLFDKMAEHNEEHLTMDFFIKNILEPCGFIPCVEYMSDKDFDNYQKLRKRKEKLKLI